MTSLQNLFCSIEELQRLCQFRGGFQNNDKGYENSAFKQIHPPLKVLVYRPPRSRVTCYFSSCDAKSYYSQLAKMPLFEFQVLN